jgi:hypothetical protein
MNPKTPPTVLYKYVMPSGVRLLTSLSLRFSAPGALNDPFESRLPVLTSLRGDPSRFGINPDAQAVGQTSDREFGISCFSEEAADLLMWAHYADAHAGLVIGFNTTHPEFSKLGQLLPVKYHTRRPVLKPSSSTDGILAGLGVKSHDWRYEKEWRLVTKLSSCTRKRGAYLKSISSDLIQIVILGLRATPQLRTRIAWWGRLHPTVQLRQARLDSLKFCLHFDENLTEDALIVMSKHGKRDPLLSIPCDPTKLSIMDLECRDGTMILRDVTPTIMSMAEKARKRPSRSK